MKISIVGRTDHIVNGGTVISDIVLNIEVSLTKRQLRRIMTDYEALKLHKNKTPLHLVGSGVSLRGVGPQFLGRDMTSGITDKSDLLMNAFKAAITSKAYHHHSKLGWPTFTKDSI